MNNDSNGNNNFNNSFNNNSINNNISKDLDMVSFLKENIDIKGYVFIVFGENKEKQEDFLALYDFDDHLKAIGSIETVKSMLIEGIKGTQKNVPTASLADTRVDSPSFQDLYNLANEKDLYIFDDDFEDDIIENNDDKDDGA